VTSHPERIDAPLHWRGPARIFVNSMSDFSHPGIPIDLLAQAYDVMSRAHWHRFLILTKRPRRMEHVLAACAVLGHTLTPWPLPNLWLGTSIESDRWTFRADYLRAAPAARRFLSLEPLLGPLPSLDLDGIDWVIVGGESGPHARPMEVEWVRDIRDDCRAAGVPFFFKQDSGRWPGRRGRFADADARPQERPRDLLVRP
jgi:protein gp37